MDRRRFFTAVVAAAGGTAVLDVAGARAQDTDAEFQQYIGSVVVVISMMGYLFDEVGRLTTNATDATFADEEWRVDALAPFAIANAAQLTMPKLQPPSIFERAHGYLAESIDDIVTAGEFMKRGVLTMDVEAINLAVQYLLQANELLDQANAAMPFGVSAPS